MKIIGLVCYVFIVLALFGAMMFNAYQGEWSAATFYLLFIVVFDHYMR